MGVTITDLIALAKAGYTPAQVKELITLSETAEQAKPEEPQGAAEANDKPQSASPEQETKPVTENAEKPATPEETVDYKALYEKTAEELKTAQAANRSQEQPDTSKQDEEHLADVIRSFM